MNKAVVIVDIETGRYFTGRFFEYREQYIWTKEISDAKQYVAANEFIKEVEDNEEDEFREVNSIFEGKVLEVKELLIFNKNK